MDEKLVDLREFHDRHKEILARGMALPALLAHLAVFAAESLVKYATSSKYRAAMHELTYRDDHGANYMTKEGLAATSSAWMHKLLPRVARAMDIYDRKAFTKCADYRAMAAEGKLKTVAARRSFG